jgi:acyl carrier protein
MTQGEIHARLTQVFREVFDSPELEIGESTTAQQVPGWDSLAHVDLIVSVEKAFGISFTTKEVMSLANVGDLLHLIERRKT